MVAKPVLRAPPHLLRCSSLKHLVLLFLAEKTGYAKKKRRKERKKEMKK